MIHVAILGFGVVGSGVADFICKNRNELLNVCTEEINIKYILDLRDFPDSPFASRILHDFDVILNDNDISIIIEAMGGSHPAYEFTVAALKSGKSVITSNKEVVANFGDEFIALAKENKVSYRFEASVGGGIPIISPLINCVRQNKIKEVRGILNGTTNYILTKMFSFGESFGKALESAQKHGYAEKNPDADILGTDAARKIAILAALATGKLFDVEGIHTEGINKIRSQDVTNAEKLGMSIKLIARCIICDEQIFIMVAPFMIGENSPLASVNGVYNAIEIIADPLGNVMFYGKGAGAGATASAIVGDIVQTINSKGSSMTPDFKKAKAPASFSSFISKNYLAFDCTQDKARSILKDAQFINSKECAIITEAISEDDASELIALFESAGIKLLSRIRLL